MLNLAERARSDYSSNESEMDLSLGLSQKLLRVLAEMVFHYVCEFRFHFFLCVPVIESFNTVWVFHTHAEPGHGRIDGCLAPQLGQTLSPLFSAFHVAVLFTCIDQGALRKKGRWSFVLLSPGILIVCFKVDLLELISWSQKLCG